MIGLQESCGGFDLEFFLEGGLQLLKPSNRLFRSPQSTIGLHREKTSRLVAEIVFASLKSQFEGFNVVIFPRRQSGSLDQSFDHFNLDGVPQTDSPVQVTSFQIGASKKGGELTTGVDGWSGTVTLFDG